MNARPGGTWWLLRHEVRMHFGPMRQMRAGGSSRLADRMNELTWLLVQIGLHWAAYYIIDAINAHNIPAKIAALVLSALAFASMTLMLSSGLRGSVTALFERGDMDLLLSSPMTSYSIFFARLGGIVVNITGTFLFFLAPLANMGALAGDLRWLALYPVVFAMAMLTASLSMVATLSLVRLLGRRRTRILAQVIGAVSGAAVFIAVNLVGNGAGSRTALLGWLLPKLSGNGAAWLLPGQALIGEPLPLIILLAMGVTAFLLSLRHTRESFIQGVAQAAGTARATRPPQGSIRFRVSRSPAIAVILKEWLLIGRDLQLISQVLLRLLYLLPLFYMLFQASSVPLSAVATLTFVCGSLAGTLAWIIIAAEDAPDLLACAPVSPLTVRRAKLVAAIAPPLALVSLPLLWLGLRAPGYGVAALIAVTLATLSASCIVLWSGRPAIRSEFKQRAKRNARSSLLEVISNAGYAGAVFLLLSSSGEGNDHYLSWSCMAAVAAGLAVLSAWHSRTRPVA